MCARDEVVAFVSRAISRRAPYDTLVSDAIGERPTDDPAVVACTGAVVKRDYDYTRYWQQAWQGYQQYTVRKLNNAYEVTLGPWLPAADR